MSNNFTLGYTSGVYDLFHIGHLNLLKNAKGLCDKLIVGVTVDNLVEYKNKRSVIPFDERIDIVRNIKYVDAAIPQEDLDKFKMWERLHFNILFVGDDWFNTERWQEMEKKFNDVGVRVVYFPYTKGTSSTLINETLIKLGKGCNKMSFFSMVFSMAKKKYEKFINKHIVTLFLKQDKHSQVEFYLIDAFEIFHFIPVYNFLLKKGVRARIVAEPQYINTSGSWFDYDTAVKILKSKHIDYCTKCNPMAQVAVTTQRSGLSKVKQNLLLLTNFMK